MSNSTLRLFFPQWQGGNNPPYYFGAQLLSWLAPVHQGPTEEVPVDLPTDKPLEIENGIVARKALLKQASYAEQLIKKHNPDQIVVLGGDCLVDLVPFAYLNEKYEGDLAILWIDAHPDIMTPDDFEHAHAMVLGNLLGQGDQEFLQFVKKPIQPSHVMYAGLHEPLENELRFIEKLNIKSASPNELEKSSQPILDWFKSTGAQHLAIHFDLDVLDATKFRSLLFAQPNIPENTFDGVAQGKMTMEQVIKILADVSKVTNVVGLGIAEHLPWDSLALKNMLAELPLIGKI